MATCNTENLPKESVLEHLNEVFGELLSLEVIKTVADTSQYNMSDSTNKLLEISNFYSSKAFKNKMNDNNPRTASNLNLMSKSATSSSTSIASNKSRKANDLERAITCINQGYKVLILMRGVPGSGKSTLAKHILQSTIGYDPNHKMHILSTDDYFCQNRYGLYMYEAAKLSEAHNWNQNRAFQYMSRGLSPIIIDNTNVQMWEMKPYATMATDYGYIIEIIEPDNHWSFNAKELARLNIHKVPKDKIQTMIENYDRNVTPHKLLNDYNLIYKHQKPPQLRLYPPPNINITTSKTLPVTNNTSSAQSNSDSVKSQITASIFNLNLNDATPQETINLMEFDDENASAPSTTKLTSPQNSSQEQHLIDKILMCNDSEATKAWQPMKNDENFIMISDSDDEIPSKQNKLASAPESNLLKAWGIDERSLRTWDIVTPIQDNVVMTPTNKKYESPQITYNDSECNTDDRYFRFLENGKLLGGDIDEIKILSTVNRDISWSTPKHKSVIPKKSTLDKSCMTDDVYENFENNISSLASLFPDVPEKHLIYWYNKGKGDLDWTVDFLLESQNETSNLAFDDDMEENHDTTVKVNESDSDSSNSNKILETPKKNKKNSDETKELKKLLESMVSISNDHYSDHLQKIRQYQTNSGNQNTSTKHNIQNKPGCSKDKEVYEVICVDSDSDLDEIEFTEKVEPTVEDTVEINLGEQFVAQLEQHFGDASMGYPEGYQPVVQLPVSLAKQLYTFYIDSVFQQMDNQKLVLESLVKEDEEFAKKLQAEENKDFNQDTEPTPNLKEIIQEQITLSKYQKEADKWKDLNPNNLASKLTRQKLFSLFPSIDKDSLVEILYAHGNKYKDTVETLMVSTGMDTISGNTDAMKEPPINDETLDEMNNAQMQNISEEYTEVREASYYREEANKYLARRTELYAKAQQYYQKGMIEVAQFYSGLASKQTQYYERANSWAATAYLDEHAKRLENFNTLDLHFLKVKEAMEALDMFLDKNINLLRLSKLKRSECLQVITGRGKHSLNGIAKLRPKVMARLKFRQIRFTPYAGILKLKITKNCNLTNEINKH